MDAVHIWFWRTDLEEGRAEELARVLTPGEREVAARFRFPRDRMRALVSRAGLRRVLAGYVGAPPENLEITKSETGKPWLAGAGALSFNLSHSGEYAAVAVSQGRELGIDIERTREGIDWRAIARRFMTSGERAWLEANPGAASFFRLWTVKEAVLKAEGKGLAAAIDRLTVRPGEDCPPWNVCELDLAPGYAAAVAFNGPPAAPRISSAQFGCQ